jgi:hypothetical protein
VRRAPSRWLDSDAFRGPISSENEQKIELVIGILNHLGAHNGQRGYRAWLDVNHDGVIDLNDIIKVLNMPTCHPHHHNHDDADE